MYKLKIVPILLACTLLLTSCTWLPWSKKNEKNSLEGTQETSATSEVAKARFEIVLNAIENKDADAIKAMFSKGALEEAEDIDGAIEYLFNLFDGEVVSWEMNSFSSDERDRKGGMDLLSHTFFTVLTENGRYRFLLLDYNRNTIDPNLQGLYAICGINATFAKTQWGSWQDLKIPGVYWPQEAGGVHPPIDNT